MTARDFWKQKFDEYPQTDADKLAVAMMKEYVFHRIAIIKASIQGALDGLELDNTDDVIEKSIVIQTFKEHLQLLK